MAAIWQTVFHLCFHEWNILYFDSDLSEICLKGTIDNKSALVEVMTIHYLPMLTQFTNTYICGTRGDELIMSSKCFLY